MTPPVESGIARRIGEMTDARIVKLVQQQTTMRLVGQALGYEFVRPETQLLVDRTVGYFGRPGRNDDCFAAALATVLQIRIHELPDPHIDERLAAGDTPAEIDRAAWSELRRWLARRGLRIVTHRQPPVTRRRWIGVVPMPGDFNDHCLVMSRGDVLFDPVAAENVRMFQAGDVAFGYSFQSSRR